MSEDVLEQYEFYLKIAEEDVRDGDATPWERVVAAWERVVAALAAEVRALRQKVSAHGRLDGAKCGDCALRVEAGPLAGECHFDPNPRPENPACEWFEESDKRLASDWECADCGRVNPGTMPYCPCREET